MTIKSTKHIKSTSIGKVLQNLDQDKNWGRFNLAASDPQSEEEAQGATDQKDQQTLDLISRALRVLLKKAGAGSAHYTLGQDQSGVRVIFKNPKVSMLTIHPVDLANLGRICKQFDALLDISVDPKTRSLVLQVLLQN